MARVTLKDRQKRIDCLAQLEDGWFDGEGVALTSAGLDAARVVVEFTDENGLALPGLFPMPDGGVSIEWLKIGTFFGVEISPTSSFSVFDIRDGITDTVDIAVVKDLIKKHVWRRG